MRLCRLVPAVLALVVALVVGAGVVGAAGPMSVYEVTITNRTMGQPLTPPALTTHSPSVHVFQVGQRASVGVQQIAENGNLAPLMAALMAGKNVDDVVKGSGPVLPGQSVTLRITAYPGARRLSAVSMLVCTNDGFTGIDALRLPKFVGDWVSGNLAAYDAGTERNTEDFNDLVPPCPVMTGVTTTKPGTGMSNPALAEGGRIWMHPGVAGVSDLQPALHGWMGPVASIVVRRVE